MKILLTLGLLALVAPQSNARELDNETQVKNAQRLAANLPQTLVVKEDANGTISVFHSASNLKPGAESSLDDSLFVNMKATDSMSELDRDSSTSGWYFYWNRNNYWYPTYYYYGYRYYYQPYYSYYNYYNNCSYRWYGWGW